MIPEIRSETDRIFGRLGSFFPFYTPIDAENQHFEKKIKKIPGYIILL